MPFPIVVRHSSLTPLSRRARSLRLGGPLGAPRGWEHIVSQPQPGGSISPSFQREVPAAGNAGRPHRGGFLFFFFEPSMLCSALLLKPPKPSGSQPARIGLTWAGTASPGTPPITSETAGTKPAIPPRCPQGGNHHPAATLCSRPSLHTAHREGITIPLQPFAPGHPSTLSAGRESPSCCNPFPVVTSSSSISTQRGQQGLPRARLQLPLCHRCQRGVSPGHGSRHEGLCPWHCPWHGKRCQDTPLSHLGQPRARPSHRSGDTGATLCRWDFSFLPGRAQRRGISATAALTHFGSRLSFFSSQFHLTPERVQTPPLTSRAVGKRVPTKNRPIKPPHGDDFFFFSPLPPLALRFSHSLPASASPTPR